MSLINDALRRAKLAQQATPPPAPTPVPHFRPVEPVSPPTRHGPGLMLPISIAAVALLSLLLFWVLTKRDGSSLDGQSKAQLAVAARTPSASETQPNSSDPRPSTASAPAAAPTFSSKPEAPQAAATPASQGPGAVITNSPGMAPDAADTNHADAAVAPQPPPLKLQSIVYNPRRPSAMISGRIVFVGERVREYHVLAIHRDEVLLAGAGTTNALILDP